jgi:hypothetical protein
MNEQDRDRFYGPGGDEWGDDGADYDLEPPDADVLAGEDRRAREALEASELAIDVDEIYSDMERASHVSLGTWDGKFKFQFGVKHLLLAMFVLSLVLTLWKLGILGGVLIAVILAAVGGALMHIYVKEQRARETANHRWVEKYERRREYLERQTGRPTVGGTGGEAASADRYSNAKPPLAGAANPAARGANRAAANRPRSPAGRPLRWQFSLRQLMIAMTISAIVFGLVRMVGGPDVAAVVLGFIILAGLIAHAMGAEPPESIILGWWLLLCLYVLMSLAAAVWSQA